MKLTSHIAVLATLLTLSAGPATRPAVVVETGIPYATGGGVDLLLDLARPADGVGPFPAIVFVHGGGWTAGRRQDFEQAIAGAAAHGYVAVTVTYRLAPAARFPAQLEDCKAAVRWLRANAARLHVDPDHIGAVGTSAGGHLVALLGTTGTDHAYDGTGGNAGRSSAVQAVVDFFGPADLTATDFDPKVVQACLVPLVGGATADEVDLCRAASPVTHVAAGDPPFLILHGDADPTVPVSQSRLMLAKLTAAGVPARLVVYPGDGHGFTPAHTADAWRQALAFLDEQLKPTAR